jgi:N-methylhydantoinase B
VRTAYRTATRLFQRQPRRPIKTKETGITIRPSDVLILESGGGGGWGNPADRDPEAIAADRENGFVTE